MPISGLGKHKSAQLREIEIFTETGKRLDGIQVTDKWIDESIRFLVREIRPMLHDNIEMSAIVEGATPVVITARKLYRSWQRKISIDKLSKLFEELGETLEYEAKTTARSIR